MFLVCFLLISYFCPKIPLQLKVWHFQIHSVVFSLLILQMFSVLVVHFISTARSDTSLVLPCDVLGILESNNYNPKEVVETLLQNLQLEHTSLKQPEPETRKWIRCLSRNANCSDRLDVVKYLREITPAGTTGRCGTSIVNDDDHE